MEITSLVKKKIATTIQGIDVVIETEFVEGNVPSVYSCNVQGVVKLVQEEVNENWFNINYTLNVSMMDVQVNTSGNVPVGFLSKLERGMLAAHELLTSQGK